MRHNRIPENLLLRSTPGAWQQAQLKHLMFEVSDRLWAPESAFRYVLFPLRGVVSLQLSSADGKQVENGLVGPEGFAEVPFLFGAEQTRVAAVALTSGEAMLMEAEQFRASLKDAEFRVRIEEYARSFH